MHRCIRCFLASTLFIAMTISSFPQILYAQDETETELKNLSSTDSKDAEADRSISEPMIPNYSVVYAVDGGSAEIEFDLDNIDQKKYEILQLKSKDTDSVLFDAENKEVPEKNSLKYQVSDSGSYKFALLYKEIATTEETGDQENTETEDTNIQEENQEQSLEQAVKENQGQSQEETQIENSEQGQEETQIENSEQGQEETQIENSEQSQEETQVEDQEQSQEEVQVENMEQSQEQVQEEDQKPEQEVEFEVKVNDNMEMEQPQSADLATETFTDGENQPDLSGHFDMSALAYTNSKSGLKYGNTDYIKIDGGTAKLSDSQAAWNMEGASAAAISVSQITAFTSKYKVDFRKSWHMVGEYFQPFVADGFTISFHNQPGYKITRNLGDGALGVYGAEGLQKGLVWEIDTFGYKNYGDDNKEYKAGAHMTVQESNGAKAPTVYTQQIRLAEGTPQNPTTKYLGKTQPFEITYDVHTKTMTWSYGGNECDKQTLQMTFANEADIIGKLGSITPYYTLACAVNYTSQLYNGGGPNSGNSELHMHTFEYTEMDPTVSATHYSALEEDGTPHDLGDADNNAIYGVSGNIIHVRHTLKDAKAIATEMEDNVSISDSLLTNGVETVLNPIPGSAKWYVDETNQKSLPDDLFGNGTTVKFPANSGEAYIAYDVKLPDNLSLDDEFRLQTGVTLGTAGMNQKHYSPDLEVIAGVSLLSHGKMIDNQCYSYDSTKTNLTNEEANELFFQDMKMKRSGTPYLNFSDIALTAPYTDFLTEASASIPDLQESLKVTNSTYKGGTGEPTAPVNIKPNELGMYYSVMNIYDTRFDGAYDATGGKGERTAVRRIWISDNYVEKDSLYGISKNMEVDEFSLSRMSDEQLKNKILSHMKIFSETATVDGNNISGDPGTKLETVNVPDITIEDFSTSSTASDTPYDVTIRANINGKNLAVPIKITVINMPVQEYVIIPARVELKSKGGIEDTYAGEKAEVKLVDPVAKKTKEISVWADTGFKLKNATTSDDYTVELYDKEKNKLPEKDGIAEVGTLSSNKKSTEVWFNTKEEPVSRGAYQGTMKFYISFKQ